MRAAWRVHPRFSACFSLQCNSVPQKSHSDNNPSYWANNGQLTWRMRRACEAKTGRFIQNCGTHTHPPPTFNKVTLAPKCCTPWAHNSHKCSIYTLHYIFRLPSNLTGQLPRKARERICRSHSSVPKLDTCQYHSFQATFSEHHCSVRSRCWKS
jgi:hypothetical protein